MRKKNVYEVEMCDDQLRFFLLPILLSRRPKSWIFSSSPIFDKSQISLFSWALVLDLHRLHVLTGRTLSLLQLECSREEECLVRAKNFSARNPQLFSFSSLLTEVPKNRSHPRLIQEYFSCLFFFFRWRASILLNCSSMDSFVFFSSSKSPCGNLDYLTGLFAWSDVVELETQEKKFDCDNYSWRKTRKTKRTCWQVWIFTTLTRWLSTMMRKDFRLNFSVFIFSTICLESGNAEFVFFEEIYSQIPKTIFDDALSLLQKLMADFRSSKRT